MVTHGLEVTEGELEPGRSGFFFILMSRMDSSAIFPMWQFMLVMAEWYMQPIADVEWSMTHQIRQTLGCMEDPAACSKKEKHGRKRI